MSSNQEATQGSRGPEQEEGASTALRSTVRGLAERLCVKVAFVCETVGPRREEARTLALSVEGNFLENLTYKLAGTPCALVCEKGVAFTASHAAERYPRDTILSDWGIDSYMGVACLAADGALVGHVGVMNDGPLEDPKRVERALRSAALELGPRLEFLRASQA